MFRLTRSRRLSRRSRAVSAVIGIAAVLWMVWIFVFQSNLPPRERRVAALPPERLSFASLASDEEIVVTTTAYQRAPIELRFRRDGAQTNVIVSEVRRSETDRTWKMVRVLRVRPLTAVEIAGLDAMMVELHERPPPYPLHAATYAIEYRRAEIEIGTEKLHETALIEERTNAERFPSAEPEFRRAKEATASALGVTPEVFWKWVTFEMLVPTDEEPGDGG